MEYPLAFQPDLELNPADFVDAWNNDPEARAIATARLEKPTNVQYDPFSVGLIAVIGSVVGTLTMEALKHLVKKAIDTALEKRRKKQSTNIQPVSQSSGTTLIIVTVVNVTNHD